MKRSIVIGALGAVVLAVAYLWPAYGGRMFSTGAERAVRERIRVHPGCPRAHLAYAALLAQQNRNAEARRELTEAERLEPGLPFAPPGATDELARKLGMAGRLLKPGPAQASF